MDISSLIPSPDAIPLSWIGFHWLLMGTFVLHLVCMNAMLGSGLIALAGMLRRRTADETAQTVSTHLPTLIAFTINTGVAPLLFVHVLYGPFIFTSSVLMAVWWLSAVALLLMAYAAAYWFDFRFAVLARPARFLILGGSVGLLLVIGFLFSTNMTRMLVPARWIRYFDHPGGMLLNMAEPMLIPRYLHFVTASAAVGGLALAWRWRFKARAGVAGAAQKSQQALGWFNGATAVQLVVGSIFLFCLPPAVRQRFMGGDGVETTLLTLSIATALIALHLGFRHRLRACTAATLATIVLMVLVRDQVRRAFIAPFFSPADLAVTPKIGPLILFIAATVLVVTAVAYLLRLASSKPPETQP